jgi:hypothetical protein
MTGWIIAASVLLIDGLLFNAFAMEGSRRSTEVLTRFFYFASGPTMVAAIFLAMRCSPRSGSSGPCRCSTPLRCETGTSCSGSSSGPWRSSPA